IIMDHVNNLIASTTFDKCFNNYGISEFELEKIIKEYCSVESLKSIEEYYSGYIMSEKKVYNPLEIFRYCTLHKIGDSYDTGIEKLLERLMKLYLEDDLNRQYLERLFDEEEIRSRKDVILILDSRNNYSFSYIINILKGAGYLSTEVKVEKSDEEERYVKFKFTNSKIKKDFQRMWYNIIDRKK
ncbi:MAG: hypothetical protein ACRC0F_00715, partial [Cetobacterium sp.]